MSWSNAVVIVFAMVCATGLAAWIGWLIHLAPPVEEEDRPEE